MSGGDAIFNSYAAETSTIVPAGKYTVKMTLGAAKISREVEVAAGDTTAVEIVAGVGRLQGSIVFSKGGQGLRDPFMEIFAGVEPVENENSVANSYGNAPRFDLASGAYRARIKADAIDRTFPFEIKVGQRLDMEFALDAGLAAFEAPGATALEVKGWARASMADRQTSRRSTRRSPCLPCRSANTLPSPSRATRSRNPSSRSPPASAR